MPHTPTETRPIRTITYVIHTRRHGQVPYPRHGEPELVQGVQAQEDQTQLPVGDLGGVLHDLGGAVQASAEEGAALVVHEAAVLDAGTARGVVSRVPVQLNGWISCHTRVTSIIATRHCSKFLVGIVYICVSSMCVCVWIPRLLRWILYRKETNWVLSFPSSCSK